MEKSLFNEIILLFTLNKDLFACGECFRFAQVSTSLRYARNDKKLLFNAENHSECHSECCSKQHLQCSWQ